MREISEYMTAKEAQQELGISNRKMTDLLAGEKPILPWVPDKLDKRIKLVRKSDVEDLRASSIKKGAA